MIVTSPAFCMDTGLPTTTKSYCMSQIEFWGDASRIEATLVPKWGYPWQAIKTARMDRPFSSLANCFNFLQCAPHSMRLTRLQHCMRTDGLLSVVIPGLHPALHQHIHITNGYAAGT